MNYLMVTYKIRADRAQEASRQIELLLAAVRQHEPETLAYQVFRRAPEVGSFVHLMMFPDSEAHMAHVSAPHVKRLVEALLPFCERGPEYAELELVDSIASLAHPLSPSLSPTQERHN